MFLNLIREFFVKKSLKNDSNDDKKEVFTKDVQTIGLLIDESNFKYTKELKEELILKGIVEQNIKVIVFRGKISNTEVYSFPVFGKNHIDWKGNIKNSFVSEFVETEFDLLISYYDFENPILMMLTNLSKAKFKVGFSSIGKKINRWMINTDLGNYKIFVSELFKYLKNIK